MMPGVVAGFPKKAGISLISSTDGTWYGYSNYDGTNFGSLSPSGASAIPGASAAVGVNGEILRMISVFDGEGFWDLRVIVRGSYASPPFSTATVDGTSFTSGWSTSALGSNTQFRWTGTRTTNILPVGTHAIAFT